MYSLCATDFILMLCAGQVETLDLNEEVVQWHQAPKPSQKRVLHKKGASRAQRAPHRATAAAPTSPIATGRNALVVAGELRVTLSDACCPCIPEHSAVSMQSTA